VVSLARVILTHCAALRPLLKTDQAGLLVAEAGDGAERLAVVLEDLGDGLHQSGDHAAERPLVQPPARRRNWMYAPGR
jgi:hypothetical protein